MQSGSNDGPSIFIDRYTGTRIFLILGFFFLNSIIKMVQKKIVLISNCEMVDVACSIKGQLEIASMIAYLHPLLSFIGRVIALILMLMYISNSKMGFDG